LESETLQPPEIAAPQLPPTPAPPAEHAVEFTATWQEYFRIWIVNLALTVATLGIYSAWAKVRRKRYFYEHTLLDGEPFEYRGRPIAILKGRVIAVVAVAITYGTGHFAPALLWAVALCAVFVVPWLVVRSFAFNAYSSAYRNIRFHFRGRYWKCWRIMLGYGVLTIVTFGLGYAFLKTRLTEFIVRNHAFGTTSFDMPDLKKTFFSAYGRMIGLGFVTGVAVGFLTAFVISQTHARPNSAIAWGLNAVSYTLYLGIFAYIRSRILNYTWNQATLGTIRFRSTLRARELFAIYVVNVVAILATLGLAAPWAVVRTLRYRAEHLAVLAGESLDSHVAAEALGVAAVGEEVGEMLDVDFSI
jgi:uncharacterized membrane protein YjgN (DUF898 family)